MKLKATLTRFAYLPTCVLGWLRVATAQAGELVIATIEDRWVRDPDGPGGQRKEGELHESCVPDGLYRLEHHVGSRWTNTWALVNPQLGVYHWPGDVPTASKYGRSAILLHAGTDDNSSLGCIILGLRHGIEANRHRVYDGAAAMDSLIAALAVGGEHELLIRPTLGTLEL